MKIFSNLKKLFTRNKKISVLNNADFISIAKTKKKIKFKTVLDVAPNFVAIVVAKEQVTDVLIEGSYKLTPTILPMTARVLKLSKPNKKGELPNEFSADIYYLNMTELNAVPFYSENYITTHSKNFKKVKVRIKGFFNFKIINPEDFFEALLTQYGFINGKLAKEEVSSWVSENAIKKINKNKPGVEELFERNTSCFVGLSQYLNSHLQDVGIEVTDITITETIFPKKIYKNVQLSYLEVLNNKPNNIIDNNEAIDKSKNVFLNESGNAEQITNTISQKDDNIYYSEQLTSSEDIIKNSLLPQKNDEEAKMSNYNNVFDKIKSSVEDFNANSKAQFEEMEETKEKVITYINCMNCGAKNSSDAKKCFKCGNSLKL